MNKSSLIPLETPANNNKFSASLTNLTPILTDNTYGVIRFDELQQCEILDGLLITDPMIFDLKLRVSQTTGIEFRTSIIREGVTLVAYQNKFNPIEEYLNGLFWDGKPRLDTFLIDHANAEDSPYTRAVTSKTLIGAVARTYDPGCKMDTMLVLEGRQGSRKSTLASSLTPNIDWFGDTELSIGNKEGLQQIQGKWLYEISEMRAAVKANQNSLKGFLSASTDNFRLPYARKPQNYPRRLIFIGTTNDDQYLTDDSGGRRFLPIKVDDIDIDAIVRIVDQLWAEAAFRFNRGEKYYLEGKVESDAIALQSSRYKIDAWESLILEYLDENKLFKVTTAMICKGALDIVTSNMDKTTQSRVISIMKRLGWKQQTIRIKGICKQGFAKKM